MASVPQGSVLGSLLYLIYSSDIPTHLTTHMATFADDICTLTSHPDPLSVSESLQDHLDNLHSWRVSINQSKSVHLTFTLRRQSCSPIKFDNIPIPPAHHVHYLGLYIDKRITWNPHTRLKKLDLNRKYGLLSQVLNRNSKLSIENKLTIYKTVFKPTSTYGIELWGSAKKGNIDRIQSFQSKVLRTILNAPGTSRTEQFITTLTFPLSMKPSNSVLNLKITLINSLMLCHLPPIPQTPLAD
ncbi:hypothetical protein AAG570_008560 [Ranatra chinensis]|uniref:Reverse transcriptase domain-containing protein n=1 Tax=Ranatra chinensis TaxID=642074 RepID=A0ABD0YRC0_9HEMI